MTNQTRILISLVIINVLFGTILHVGPGWGLQSIQEGIDSALDGDTVLVDDGLYFENLILNKEIILTSLIIFDDPDNWQNNPHVINTVIDGGNALPGAVYGSCITIVPALDPEGIPIPISPQISGFTLQHGHGTRVTEISSFGDNFIQHLRYGGGVLIAGTVPLLKFNRFLDNGIPNRAAGVAKGGAAYAGTDVDIDEIRLGTTASVQLTRNDSLSFAHNLFLGNSAGIGKSLFVQGYPGTVDVKNGFFDVWDCSHDDVSAVWVASSPDVSFDFAMGAGQICAIDHDLWVSPAGSDVGGTGEPDFPFRTLTHALDLISPGEFNPITIHLASGIYAPNNNGEEFPLNLPDNCALSGDFPGPAILDAELTGRLITLNNVMNARLERLTITGGNVASWAGGGIGLWNSRLYLLNTTIVGNTALSGGGIYAENSQLQLVNSIVWDNSPPQLHFNGSRLPVHGAIAFSDILGGSDGVYSNIPENIFWLDGNLETAPQFVDDFCLSGSSPCINAGIDNAALSYNANQDTLFVPPLDFFGDSPDMGACESLAGGFLSGDMDQNGLLNIVDIVIMVDLTLNGGAGPYEMLAGDIDGSGEINIVDIVLLVDIILNL